MTEGVAPRPTLPIGVLSCDAVVGEGDRREAVEGAATRTRLQKARITPGLFIFTTSAVGSSPYAAGVGEVAPKETEGAAARQAAYSVPSWQR